MARNRKPNILMTPLCALLMIAAVGVCIFPFLNLQEGSLLYSILSPMRAFIDSWANPLAGSSLSAYGLIPLAFLCVVNFVLALLGSGLLAFLLRAVAYYGAYILSVVLLDGTPENHLILTVLPDNLLHVVLIGSAALVVSVALLAIIYKVRHRKPPVRKTVGPGVENPVIPTEQPASEPGEDRPFSLSFREEEIPEAEKPEAPKFERNPAEYRQSIDSLLDVKIPEFSTYPN